MAASRDGAHSRPPLWISLVLLLDAAALVAIYFATVEGLWAHGWDTPALSLLTAALYAGTAVLVRARPGMLANAFAAGLAFLAGAAAVTVAMVVIWPGGEPFALDDPDERARLALVLFGVVNFAPSGWLLLRRGMAGYLQMRLGYGAAALALAGLGMASYALSGPLDSSMRAARADRETTLARDAMAVQLCAWRWSRSHGGAYPPTLEAMGPAGSGCLDEDVGADGALRYVAAGAHFRVEGEIPERNDAPEFHVLGDHLGRLSRWSYHDAAHDWDRTDGAPRILATLHHCLHAVRATGVEPGGAEELAGAAAAVGGPACPDVVQIYLGPEASRRMIEARWFDFAFVPGAPGLGYVQARPVRFAETALRSYVMSAEGAVHYTTEDRPATTRDPRLPDCRPWDGGDCVPNAPDAPRVVQLIHPAVLDRDAFFEVRVAVLGDSSRAPQRLTWRVECGLEGEDVTPPPAERIVYMEPTTSCRPPDTGQALPLGDRIIVGVWLRGPDGTLVLQADTVPLRP